MISQTVPSGSTRPNRCGSLGRGRGDRRRRVGPGRGPGRGGPGRGAGLGVADCAAWLAGRHLRYLVPSARTLRAPAARRGACTSFERYSNRSPRPCPRLSRCICLRSFPTTTGGRAMDKADIAALLALGAAFFIAIGDVIHQRSAHEVTDEPVSHVDLFLRLLRDRPVVAGQRRRGRRVRAAGRGAGLGFGAAGAGAAGDVAAVRAADQRPAVASAGDPLGMDVGGAAGRGGRGDRDRRQSDRGPLPGVVRDVDGGGRRARARAGAVRGGRADLVRARQRGAAGGGVRRAVGRVRGADQGRGGPARRRSVGAAAHARAVRLGAGRRSRARPGSSRRSGPVR